MTYNRHLPTLDSMTALYAATEDERRDALARSLLDRPAAESRAMWLAWQDGGRGQEPKSREFLADMRRRIDAERARRAEDAPDVVRAQARPAR